MIYDPDSTGYIAPHEAAEAARALGFNPSEVSAMLCDPPPAPAAWHGHPAAGRPGVCTRPSPNPPSHHHPCPDFVVGVSPVPYLISVLGECRIEANEWGVHPPPLPRSLARGFTQPPSPAPLGSGSHPPTHGIEPSQ